MEKLTYLKSHYESHTTLDFTTSKITSVQILNQRVMVLTPNVITVEELVKAIGNHYDRVPRAFYVIAQAGSSPARPVFYPVKTFASSPVFSEREWVRKGSPAE